MEQFAELFSIHGIFTLFMLILLQAVLGFDNLLYISIESKRVEESQQRLVRRIGIGVAILLRILLLFIANLSSLHLSLGAKAHAYSLNGQT